MHLTTKSGRKILLNNDDEEAKINAGIAADPDTYELSDAEFAELTPLRGRPVQAVTKTPIKLRLDPDIVSTFKAQGRGWQTRMNDALREWLSTHSL